MQTLLAKISSKINQSNINKLLHEDLPYYITRIAGVLLLILMFFTFTDVVARYVFSLPLKGSAEVTEIIQTLFIAGGIFVVTLLGTHIEVEIIEKFFPEKFKKWRNIVFKILFAICFYFISIRIFQIAERTNRRGEVTEYWHLPLGYLQYYVAAMLMATTIFLILKLILDTLSGFEKTGKKS